MSSTIFSDIIVPGVGIDFGPGPDQVTISQGIVVGSTANDGVHSLHDQSTLDNFGAVFSVDHYGVDFAGNGDLILNEKDATIIGGPSGGFLSGGTGIRLDGNGDTVENFGGVFGEGFLGTGMFIDFAAVNAQLINHGSVGGSFFGVLADSHQDGSVIHNYASISSLLYGIDVFTLHGLTTIVNNAKGATITGASAAIYVAVGALNLVNAGTLNGGINIVDTTASDNIVNHGKINGSVILSGAFDFFNGKDGTSSDIFTGAGHDIVQVGKGKVSVHINDAGHTAVTAGAGHDKFVFDNCLGGGKIVIKHFSAAIDHIVLSETFFHGLGPLGKLHGNHFAIDGNAGNGLPQIVYNSHTGVLSYDSNGEFPGGQTPFAHLAGDPPVSHATFLLVA